MYHSDVAAVRQIEVFECRKKHDEPATKVYFLIHDKTVEEQAYLTALRREKQAFELLIQTKCVSFKLRHLYESILNRLLKGGDSLFRCIFYVHVTREPGAL